jgi:putative FmdB family regulatory protein
VPIYEYLCSKCNVIYQFLVRSSGDGTSPVCPRCGHSPLERVMSTFSTSGRDRVSSSTGDDLPDMSGIDENDPKSMARAIRNMARDMGEDLGPELDEAIARLESGEDPDDVERDLEETGYGETGGAPPPAHDTGLYEA